MGLPRSEGSKVDNVKSNISYVSSRIVCDVVYCQQQIYAIMNGTEKKLKGVSICPKEGKRIKKNGSRPVVLPPTSSEQTTSQERSEHHYPQPETGKNHTRRILSHKHCLSSSSFFVGTD